jgi:hypothetical protein
MDRSYTLKSDDGNQRAKVAGLLDPFHYVREADRALVCGNRAEAVASISLAYLAFDVISSDCE